MGDAIGVGAYALVYTFLESLAYFVLILLIGLILPWKWKSDKVFAHLGYISLWLPIWPILDQLYRYKEFAEPNFLAECLLSTAHPLWFLAAGAGLFIVIMDWSLVVPLYFIYNKQRVEKKVIDFLGRVSLLSTIYMLIDVISIVIIVIRNID
ncbi:MAG: hypothetical protein PVF83_18665 [Anaerolineales bacterium]|jgi:hypothetical protein